MKVSVTSAGNFKTLTTIGEHKFLIISNILYLSKKNNITVAIINKGRTSFIYQNNLIFIFENMFLKDGTRIGGISIIKSEISPFNKIVINFPTKIIEKISDIAQTKLAFKEIPDNKPKITPS